MSLRLATVALNQLTHFKEEGMTKKRKVRSWKAWATISHDGKSLEWVMLPGDSAKHYIVTDKKDRGEDCIEVTITERRRKA